MPMNAIPTFIARALHLARYVQLLEMTANYKVNVLTYEVVVYSY